MISIMDLLIIRDHLVEKYLKEIKNTGKWRNESVINALVAQLQLIHFLLYDYNSKN